MAWLSRQKNTRTPPKKKKKPRSVKWSQQGQYTKIYKNEMLFLYTSNKFMNTKIKNIMMPLIPQKIKELDV